ncbi:hydrogenase nickel incorporation protein HypB [Halomicronema sp. CCY15110]|uniref:hydrogenase nickel incorporation protein HypB n=1 Tax=Halomicronema sp. CCY15110 TaxID=2767773 RepID=UPI00194FA795|nr:hydrogenase nickel incorporation protein HypB [Halomicronema sp. CCY15110]
MCVTCGCSDGAQATYTQPGAATTTATEADSHTHVLADGTVVTHRHAGHEHAPHNHSPAPAHEPPQTDRAAIAAPVTLPRSAAVHARAHGTTLTLEQNLLAKNDRLATQNRDWFQTHHITALNLVSSPGAGKTTLLVQTIADLQPEIPMAVIEGDQETVNDAERIAATGCPAIQVNTGTGCHLEAAMIDRGLKTLNPPDHSLVLIENVGNLVCPALFDLGENAKVAMLSVTEGEDKPLKYPHMFRASQVMVLTKIDLLPYVNFDVQRCLDYARQVNPQLRIFQVSATTGAGLTEWYDWLRSTVMVTEF